MLYCRYFLVSWIKRVFTSKYPSLDHILKKLVKFCGQRVLKVLKCGYFNGPIKQALKENINGSVHCNTRQETI